MKSRWPLIIVLLLSAGVFTLGIGWGLPSSGVDRYLFCDRTPWTGQQIIDLAGGWDTEKNIGADIDRNPLGKRDRVIWLNETDAQRAEIVRRYRLFSYQPDEMITFRALSQIKPGSLQFDPKLYQYGGLWIYPVGAMLKVASLQWIGFVHLTPDLAYYLDHPEAFGRFYVVARLYSVLWGLIGVVTVYSILKKLTADDWMSALGSLGFALLPVVVCMSHEAKPHLGGAVLMLLAIRAAMAFVESGSTRSALLTGVLCGAAIGMVPTSLPVFLILPAMVLMRPFAMNERVKLVLLAGAAGVGVYAITNPYVLINLLLHRELLTSNAVNTGAMYAVHDLLGGAFNATLLIGEGTSMIILLAGVVGWLTLHFSPPVLRKQLVLLALPAIAITALYAVVAAGKPGEFGRFFILPDVALLIGAVMALRRFTHARIQRLVGSFLLFLIAWAGAKYLAGFEYDARGSGTRDRLAAMIAKVSKSENAIVVYTEPAPYCFPPADLFQNRVLLLPLQQSIETSSVDWFIRPIDRVDSRVIPITTYFTNVSIRGSTTPISWADKPFVVFWQDRLFYKHSTTAASKRFD